jgi:hypothetical protein
MFESLTLITVSLVLWFAWQFKSLGLTSNVPLDEGNRARYFAAQTLEVVKKELSGADIVALGTHSIEYHSHTKDQPNSKIWSEDGETKLLKDGASCTLHDKTGHVELNFEKLSAEGLMVKINATVGESAKHELGVRLSAHMPA